MPTRQVTVPTTVVQILAFNPTRTSVTIRNLSGSDVFISHDRVDLPTKGFRLNIGDAISLSRPLGDEPELEMNAQAVGPASATIAIFESFAGKV